MRSSKLMSTPPTDPDRGLHRVGRALAARNEQLAVQMVERIRDQVPAYSKVDPAVFARVTELSAATALAISNALMSHAPVRRGDIPIIGEQAADRMRSGIDLESFLHAYRAALFFYWDSAMDEVARLRLTRTAGRSVGRFVLDSIDTITTHAAEAFLREDSRVRAAAGRAVFDLVDSLISGRPFPSRISSVAPGLDPSRPAQVIVARVTEASTDLSAALTTALEVLQRSLALGTASPLGTIRHEEVVIIAPGSPPISRLHSAARSAREHEVQISIGASDSPGGFAGIADAYSAAALTLSYAGRDRPVVTLAELRPLQLLLLSSGSVARQLIREKATPLAALTETERDIATATIAAFTAADMNVTSAAAALQVHSNTLRYRLARIARSTGLDPRNFADLADLHCILELQRTGEDIA